MHSQKTLPLTLSALVGLAGYARASGGNQPETSYDCATHSEPYQLAYGNYTVNAAFESYTDIDLFEFWGTAGDPIRIPFLTLTNDLDPCLSLYSPSNQLIARDCCSSPWYSLCSFLLDESDFLVGTTLPETGVYRLVVEEMGVDNTGNYTFQLERVPPLRAQRHLAYNTPTRDVLDTWTDLDYFEFCGQAGSLMQLSFLTLDNDIDPRVEIRDPSGGLIATPGCDSPWYSLCSFSHTFTLPATGEYRLFVYDSGVDNYGDYELSINCIVGCPPLASAVQRNGSGVNPLVFASTCPPAIGGSWKGEIDCNGHTGATATAIFAFERPLIPGLPVANGELLVDTSSARVCGTSRSPVDADGISRHEVAIPCDPILAGLQISAQALILGGTPSRVLTNAVDIVVGY